MRSLSVRAKTPLKSTVGHKMPNKIDIKIKRQVTTTKKRHQSAVEQDQDARRRDDQTRHSRSFHERLLSRRMMNSHLDSTLNYKSTD